MRLRRPLSFSHLWQSLTQRNALGCERRGLFAGRHSGDGPILCEIPWAGDGPHWKWRDFRGDYPL